MNDEIINKIKSGQVGILPTDTIYGIVGNALNQNVYERIAQLKNRDLSHKFVILVASWQQVSDLGVELSGGQRQNLSQLWPGPNTAVLDATKGPEHLLAHDRTIALRWPDKASLTNLVEQTGPVIATSVNSSGEPFINSIDAIKLRFNNLDFYVPGEVYNQPSQIIRIFPDGSTQKLR